MNIDYGEIGVVVKEAFANYLTEKGIDRVAFAQKHHEALGLTYASTLAYLRNVEAGSAKAFLPKAKTNFGGFTGGTDVVRARRLLGRYATLCKLLDLGEDHDAVGLVESSFEGFQY